MNEDSKNFEARDLILYGITDRHWLDKDCDGKAREKKMTLYEQVEIAINSGATMIQLREKDLSDEEILSEAIELNDLCKNKSIPLIINDNIELAINSGAAGVHMGQNDMNADIARKLIPKDMILGVSAATIEEAVAAENAGADYLGVGDVFGTSTKDNARHITPDVLKNICSSVSIPVVAIGGITYENVSELRETGVSGIAVISAIFSKHDISKATAQLKEKVLDIVS